jgi:hypothetical protein
VDGVHLRQGRRESHESQTMRRAPLQQGVHFSARVASLAPTPPPSPQARADQPQSPGRYRTVPPAWDALSADGICIGGPESQNPGGHPPGVHEALGPSSRPEREARSGENFSAHSSGLPRRKGLSPSLRFARLPSRRRARLGRRAGVIMDATLPHRAPNTYYGQWLRRFLRKGGRQRRGQCP